MRRSAKVSAFTHAIVMALVVVAGCGDDDDSGGIGGFPATGSGAGGVTGGSGTGAVSGGGGAGMPSLDGGGVSCGATRCAPGEICISDRCRRQCTSAAQCGDDSCCRGVCTDTDSDRSNCGACNQACGDGLLCNDGECGEPMCAGDSGEPIDPGNELDGGVDDDAGASEPPVYGDNGCPPNESCVAEGNDAVCRCGSGAGCPPDQYCSEQGACMCGDGDACEDGESCCGDTCRDLQSDEANCGLCGRTCRAGHVCRDGECACPDAGETLCGDTCVDTDTDEDHCGDCRTRCADGATCEAGECACDEAGRMACDGECVELDTSDNCGECGEVCEAPAVCRDPSGARPLGCYCPNVNDVPCDGACVALGTVENCGACGDSCGAPQSVCRAGECQCPTAGESACGDDCVDLSAGVDDGGGTVTHCGACGVTCLAGAACVDGECSCPGGSTIDKYCDEHPTTGATDGTYACIDVDTTKNCGDCGNACLDDSACVSTGGGDQPGEWSCDCADDGFTHCAGTGCTTLGNDEANCGACGNQCPENATCTSGTCDCPGAASVRACLDDGEPACVDTNTDRDHCGECGNACGADEECCDGNCVDPDTDYDDDRLNCGQCGRRCANSGCGFLDLFECGCNNGACET